MFLKKIYTEENNFFGVIEFKDGINFIFGEKDNANDNKDSLNGIGKSFFLDFIDYCLLSNQSSRIKLAINKKILKEEVIVLEFEVNNIDYVIKRSIKTPNKNIIFGKINSELETYTDKQLKPILCDLMFKNENYEGKYYNNWLRMLVPFFVKIQTAKKDKFNDPIHYINEAKIMELNLYHLFLMDIDNTLSYKNFEIQSGIKKIEPAIKEVRELVQDTYGLQDISEATNEVDNINNEIKKLEDVIATFKLEDQYKDVEGQANQLTSEIKDLWFENYSDRKKIDTYKESSNIDIEISSKKIETLYKEVNEILANKIKKTLDDAIEFRKKISTSRKEFIKNEIDQLGKIIKERESKIQNLEVSRAKFFNFLSTKNAIKDLSEAYLLLSEKKEKMKELEGKTMLYSSLKKEMAELKSEEAKIYTQTIEFLDVIKNEISEFRAVFTYVYNAIYTQNKNQSVFTLDSNDKKDAKININISFPADLSKGKNYGRTLIYDLAILFNAINKNLNTPRFLIHDGIFDGMDKAHFIQLYELIEEKIKTQRFQYIITLNEEGTLSSNFGNAEKVTPEKIKNEAILTLSPNKKLLGKSF